MPNFFKHYSIQFWLLCLSSYLFTASFNMMMPELPSYLDKLGGGEYKGLIIAAFTFTACVSRPFSGRLTDRIGRIPVMIYGSLVCVICGFLYPMATAVVGFLAVRVIHGFSTGFKPTGTTAYVSDIVDDNRRGEAMGLNSVFSNIGMASGPLLGNFIVTHFSYNHMFYWTSVFALLSVLVLLGMKETLVVREKFKFSLLKISWKDTFDLRVFSPFVVLLLSVFPYGIILTLGADYCKFVGIDNPGIYFTTFTVSSLIVRFFAGKASDRFGRILILKISTLLMACSMLLMAISATAFEFLVASALFGVALGTNIPAVFAWALDLSHPDHRGKAMATVYIALEIGIGSGALISGFVWGNNSTMFRPTFLLGGIIVLLAFLYLVSRKNISVLNSILK